MLRMTKQRKKVYQCLKNSEKPLSAETIYELIDEDKLNLSTVYRAIDYFENNNLLIKFHFNGKNYYFLEKDGNHHHYFVCTNCHMMHKIKCNMKTIITDLENERNFKVTNHEMNVYGICNLCS